MKDYNKIKAEQTEHGIIVHEVDNGDETEKIRYSAIRAGLNWPVKGSPGYYCILGEEFVGRDIFKKEQPRGRITLLKELQASEPFLDVFFLPLTDDCTLFHCEKIYTDLTDEHEDDAQFYRDYKYKRNISLGNLEQAPYLGNFKLGISIIRSWIDEQILQIPQDTIVYDQLSQIAKMDLDASPETNYFAVNALRLGIGSFYKSAPSTGKPFRPNRKKRFFPSSSSTGALSRFK